MNEKYLLLNEIGSRKIRHSDIMRLDGTKRVEALPWGLTFGLNT